MKVILDSKNVQVVIQRLAHQLLENHKDFSNSAIIGIQPRGIPLAQKLVSYLKEKLSKDILFGKIDNTFYRDDIHTSSQIHLPAATEIPFSIEDKQVILVDDVLYTGRTIRSSLDAILDFGRPNKVELLTLVDRRYSRELPIQPDYVGIRVDSLFTQKVKVKWTETEGMDEVILLDIENK